MLHVICTVFQRSITLRRMVDGFILQTAPNWILHIVHDGPATEEIRAVMSIYNDPRILYEETPTVNGAWGHPNRQMMLKKMTPNPTDYVLITNDDNVYVPVFVEYMLQKTKRGEGLVYCDTIHSYMGYNVLKTQLRENLIDMGSFIVRADVAVKVGFNHMHLSADGTYAERCAAYCRTARIPMEYIPKSLFIHC